ncbi:YGGT family protein [Scopulibacillus darangshiensis]|uniref:YGGT family protein n=1 Tax=Scopulibacillus darangshiensis TaxID=442528 RepID=A0A4R2NY93_9BACL|nr:YggT family protein [Scopulibacillus darangshiensis]TCP26594.1 YGGT family protein [Scopulibacillus darangshiensis]
MKNKKPSVFVRFINIVLSIVQIILGLFIVLKLFGAAKVPFVSWINSLADPLLNPFKGIFDPVTFSGQYVLDLSAVFALIVYSVIGYILIKIFGSIGKG